MLIKGRKFQYFLTFQAYQEHEINKNLKVETDTDEQVKQLQAQFDEIESKLKKKSIEVDKKCATIRELQQQNDKLEDEVIDRTKVSILFVNFFPQLFRCF